MTESKENLKKRIDTNKNQHIENNEVDNFVKDKNNGDVDLNKLGEYLNNLPLYNNDELKKALNDFFRSSEWNKYNQEIENKVKNNQSLNKTELSLLYLAMISDPNTHLSSKEELNFDSNKPIDQICNGALISFIRTKYNILTYTGKKTNIKIPNESKNESVNPLDKAKNGGNIKLPDNIGEVKESEADFYCDRLITRAEQNFPNDVDKAKREIEHKHRYKDDIEKKAYIKRDILLIAFEKYTEAINKQHEKLITNSGYKDKNDFENQMKLIEEFGKEIQKKYPNIDEIFSIIKNFDEDMKENEKKYFKNENETKKAEKNYKEFNKYMDKKSKEYDIDKIQDSLKKEPKTKEEVEEYLRNMNIIFEFQEDLDKKNKTYGDSIKKYQKFIKGNISIQKKYNIQQYKDTLEKYNQDVSNWSKKIDFKKYENYKNGLDWRIEVGLRNICTLQGIITDPQNEYFPVKEIKDAERQKQIKQDGIDRLRERIKRISPGTYWTLTTLTGLWNGLIDATIGVSTSLGVMILGIIGGRDETLSQMDRKAKRDDFFKIGQSSKQKEAVYSPETGFNFNADNTVSTVASSISQMLTLIYGGGAIGSGATKVFGISESIAGRVGLFTSSFITQVGGSYQEAIKNGLDGKNAIGYSFLSASIQSSLELISPNDVLLGKGSGITKELIRNACNAGGKKGFMLIGKTFLKNVGLDIIKEDIQEGIQTVAGNLINMVVNKIYGSKLETDRSWKNFAATAIITTLTTGITTGVSTGIQMYEMSNQDQTRLIESIKKSNNGLYLEVTGMLDKAIEGKVNIPNVSIQQLQELKLKLTGNNSSETNIPGTNINNPSHHTNTDIIQTNYEITLPKEAERYTQILGSKFHEERRKSRLKSDGTYEPRIEKATDQEWISQHNGQTEVDIANTNFEDLPSNRKYENLEAAKVAIGLIFEKVSKGEEITPKMIEEMSEIVHNKRLERNGTEGSFENQRVPYEQLSEEEKAKDRNQLLRAIETVKENNQTDYFNGKPHKFEVTENQARSNSEMMDNLLKEINEQNKSERLEELRKNISEQYKQAKGEELNLTDEQLFSILDAHEQDGVLGELTLGQLKQKVKILNETITDPKIRRFLLEAGFCGSRLGSLSFRNKNQNYQYGLNYKEQSNITHRYQINEEVRIPRSDGSSTRARIVSYNPDGTYTANRNEDGYIKGNTFTQREIYDENHLRMNPYELNRFHNYLQLNLKLPGLSQKNNRELGRKLVTQQLIPKNKVDLGNGMYLYTTNKIIGSNSRREYIIGYVIDNSGNIYLRPYYRSMSEGCWRACPGMREEDGNLSKGESISNSSYETTTKIDFNLGNAFDSLDSNYYNDFGQYGKYFEYSPISYIANECNKACFLEDEMGPHNISIWKLFPELVGHDDTGHNRYNATDFYSGMYQHTIKNVIKGYNELVPEGLDYKHMKINPSKGYTYYHKYLGKINVQVCTIKRNGRDLDFHFARAVNSPDKVRIENVTFSDNQLNSWGLYKRQINAGPLVAKPVDYDGQCPNGPEKDQLLPKFINSEYRDIRILYQGNPIIKKFKKISK